MARHLICFALLLGLAAGCGQSPPPADLTEMALRQVRSGQYDEAIASASEALANKPENAAAYLYRGRAYHFRNAMGDPQRAIADFGEAIRLAPESPDAYYSRSLVFRDLGQQDLAAADDEQARSLDGLLDDTYKRLPDMTPPSAMAKVPNDAALKESKSGLPKSDAAKREMYEQLKGQFEPGFGEIRTPKTTEPDTRAAGAPEDSYVDRYRKLLGESNQSEPSAGPAATLTGPTLQELLQPMPAADPVPTLGNSGTTNPPAADVTVAPPGLSGIPGSGNPGFGNSGPTSPSTAAALPRSWQPPQVRPPLTSPFAQRPSMQSATDQLPPSGLQSPFPQRQSGATGYVQPVNPFGAQTGQPTMSRPFSTTPSPTRPSNPWVRPENPRDYLP